MGVQYDLALFEQLNEEFRSNPIAPEMVKRAEAGQKGRIESELDLANREIAGRKIAQVAKQVDLQDKVVLEVGCGRGWVTAGLPEAGARAAFGVDLKEYPAWSEHRDGRVRLLVGDLSSEELLVPGSVDVVISSVVFEHVARPLQMLDALYRLLGDDGQAWLRFNLFTARNASHRYREIYFPWPHLLFDDEVCRAFYTKLIGRPRSFSWVNCMTFAHYVEAFREVGFRIARVTRTVSEIDVEFYSRFADRLGRYPALDLETDFATFVLDKRAEPDVQLPSYVERQLVLDQRVEEHRREHASDLSA